MKEKQIKPEFAGEIKAEIKGLSKIEDNIVEVKKFAEALNDYYSSIVWTEDTLTDAKNEKANVNKFKDKVSEFRKKIVAEYNKPIELFERTAKDTEALLKETYENINAQVKRYEDETKEHIKNLCIEYFDECILSKNIDFVSFGSMNMNITLGLQTKSGDLTKKAKEEIMEYADKIKNDVELIGSLEFRDEIMVEYKKTLNASQSILNVQERMKQIEIEKQKQEELQKIKEAEEKTIAKVESVISAPVEEEKKYSMTFKVTGTIEQLKSIKYYLEQLKKDGVTYE